MTEKSQPRQRGTGRVFQQRGCSRWTIQYYRNGQRIREATGTTDKKVALQKLRQRLGQIANGVFVSPQVERIRVEALFQPYLDDLAMRGKGTRHPTRHWKLHLEPFFGWRRVLSVGTDALNQYVNERKETAKPATINREIAALRGMFRLGYHSDPPKLMRLPKFPHLEENNTRLGFMEFDQYQKIRALDAPTWLKALIEVYHTYGWRKREVLSMRVRQVDFLAGDIRLDVGTTKNRDGREAPMTERVKALLAECAKGKKPDDFLFTRPNGLPVREFRKAWRNLCDEAGLPRLLIHDLRRTAARNLRRAGVTEGVIMKMGGWKTRSVFERYNITDQRDKREALQKLEQAQEVEFGHKVGHHSAKQPQQESTSKERMVN
jgi:integrase